MTSPRRPAIVGVAEYPLVNGRVPEGTTPLQVQAQVAMAAVEQAGIRLGEVDGLLCAGAWSLLSAGQHITLTLGEYLGLQPRFVDSTNIGGASFEAHLAHACMAVEAGYCDVALITYGSTQRSDRQRSLRGRAPELNMQFETPWGMLSPVGGYAMAAARYAHEYGDPRAALTEIAVAARSWAAVNPAATLRTPITEHDVNTSPLVSDPLRKLDCCLVTDGGGAVVVTTAARARDCALPPVFPAGYAESQRQWTMTSTADLTVTPAAQTGRRALEMAGLRHEDIDIAEIYDSFTITVLLTLESLGFCGRGEAPAFVAAGRTRPGGGFPMNTNGGGLAYGHPGMYGIYLITEACRQLWGLCESARQVRNATTAMISGTGGALSSSATAVLTLGG